MAAALVERALEDKIRARLHDPEDAWFEGINAPFRTFSAKITLGKALRVFDSDIEARLTIIKNVRNVFAHRALPLDFSHPTIIAECKKLPVSPDHDMGQTPREIFAIGCLAMARSLGMKAIGRASGVPVSTKAASSTRSVPSE